MVEENINDSNEKPEVDTHADIPLPLGIAGVLAYFVPVIGGVFFLFAEKRNKFLRFHCVQSILFWVFFGLCFVLTGIIESSFLAKLVALVFLIAWIYIMYQAMSKKLSRLPVIGDIAHRHIYGE